MSYTNQDSIENFIKRSLDTDEVALLPSILVSVDSYIDSVVGGSFGDVEETTRYYDGGSRYIDIDTCHEVTKIELVDAYENLEHEYELGVSFELLPRNETYKTSIESRVGKFPYGSGNIAVTGKFTEGEEIPEDIEYLATYLSGQLLSGNVVENLKSESIEGYSRTFSDMVENNQVIKMILDKYTKDDILI